MRTGPDSHFVAFQEALVGQYSLEREIGRGGMGIVYLAHEVALDRPVALKVMPPAFAANPALRQRFLREARTAAKLSHPHIVPIHTVAEAGDFVYFAMAYIEGETLGARVRSRGPLPGREAVRVLREVAWALAYAHSEGIVHRDVKPDNILLERGTGRALVTDFGIARVGDDPGSDGTSQVVGTAEFMSPEQASGGVVDARSDIYSLGVVGFHALTARLPFEGDSAAAVLAKHLTVAPPPVGSLAPEVPARLAAGIDRCLRKEPADRFPDCATFAEAVNAGMEIQAELPVPLRIFVNRARELSATAPLLLALWVLVGLVLLIVDLSRGPLWVPPMLVAVGMAIPLGAIGLAARRLLEAGYGLDDARLALARDGERRIEELRFEYGKGLSVLDHVLRVFAAGGLATAVIGIVLAVLGWDSAVVSVIGFDVGVLAAIGAGMRGKYRHDLVGEGALAFLRSPLGDATFAVSGLGTTTGALGGGAHRPTEMAIGLAADRLFDELPKALRRDLADLPDTIERLERDARAMRLHVEALDGVLAEIGNDALGPGGEERLAVRGEVARTREEAMGRMRHAITALEKIRLGLLRLHAGDGNVDNLTVELGTARELSGAIERLIEGQREVQRLLGQRVRTLETAISSTG